MSISMTIRSGTARTFPQRGDSDLYGEVTSWANDVTTAINASPTTSQSATYDAIVGSAANVTAGIATHSDIATAIAAVSANDRIYILENTYEPAAQIDITKALTIIGQGEGVDIQGDNLATGAVIKISATGVTLENIKITQGTGTPTYAIEIAAALERIYLNIKADGTFSSGLFLNGSDVGAITGFIAYDTNSVFFGGESQMVEQVKVQDQTTPAYNLVIQADSDASVMSADRIVTIDINNAARAIDMKGDLTISGDLITVGDDSVTLTTSAATDVTLPTTGTLVTLDGAETLTQKTITAPDINGGTADSLTGFSIRSSGAAFDLEFDTSEVLTGNKIISWNVADTNRSITLEGDIDITGNFSTVGDDNVTLTTSAATDVTLPTTGTLATLDGVETFTQKTLTAPDINGGTADSLTGFSIRSSGAAFDLEFDTAEVLTAGHIVSWNVGDGDRTLTFNENFTIGNGFNVTITAEDADSSITLDEQTVEFEGEGTATQLMKFVNANNAAATLTLEGTASVINQDVTSDADVNFTTVTCVTDIDTPLVTNDSADVTVSTTTSGNINLNPVDTIVKVNSAADTSATTQTVKFGDDTGGISGIRNLNGELQYNSGGGGWTAFNSEGGINYITNGGAEVDTTGWATYADAAGTVPVDGTGGAPTVTWTRDTTTPLRGAGEFVLTKDAADRQGEGASYDFNIDVADIHSVLSISFDATTSANYADDDIVVYMYNTDSSIGIEPVPMELKAGEYGRYYAQFQTSHTDNSYRLIFHVSSTNASAYTVNIDNIKVGPSARNFGAPITDWTAWTPTGTWSSNTTYNGFWRRVGSQMELDIHVALSGAPDATTLTVDIPSGYTIDTAKLAASGDTNNYSFGLCTISDANDVDYYAFVGYSDTNTIQPKLYKTDSTYLGNPTGMNNSVPFTFASGDEIYMKFSIPITGWGSSVQMSDQDETRVVAAMYTSSDGDSYASGAIYDFEDKLIDTHSAVTIGATWKFTAPVSGKYRASCIVTASHGDGNLDDGEVCQLFIHKNGNFYAVLDGYEATASSANNITIINSGSVIIELDKNDYIDFRSFDNTGVSHTLEPTSGYNTISIERITGPSAIAANELVSARYDTDAGQSIDNASIEIINFDSTTFGWDSHGIVSTGVSWQAVAPISGKYLITTYLQLASSASWTAGELVYASVYKNGVETARLFRVEVQTSGTYALTAQGATVINMAVGDYIDIRLYQNAGGAVALASSEETNWMSIHRIGF